jgi:hypothetical protein
MYAIKMGTEELLQLHEITACPWSSERESENAYCRYFHIIFIKLK